MEAAYGKCPSAAFSDGLGDKRSGVRRRRSGEAETERALRRAARRRGPGAGGLGRVLRRGRRVLRAWGGRSAVRVALILVVQSLPVVRVTVCVLYAQSWPLGRFYTTGFCASVFKGPS